MMPLGADKFDCGIPDMEMITTLVHMRYKPETQVHGDQHYWALAGKG